MWMIIGIFFLMLLIGVPVAFGVGISSMLYLALNGKDLVILTQRIFAGGDSFTLMAIPLFIFAGEIMNACGVTKRIVGFANELVGFIPGGLAHVNILASMLFAGVSGSTSADVASIGGMLIGSRFRPRLRHRCHRCIRNHRFHHSAIYPDGAVQLHHRYLRW